MALLTIAILISIILALFIILITFLIFNQLKYLVSIMSKLTVDTNISDDEDDNEKELRTNKSKRNNTSTYGGVITERRQNLLDSINRDKIKIQEYNRIAREKLKENTKSSVLGGDKNITISESRIDLQKDMNKTKYMNYKLYGTITNSSGNTLRNECTSNSSGIHNKLHNESHSESQIRNDNEVLTKEQLLKARLNFFNK